MHISSTVNGTLQAALSCWDALQAALPALTADAGIVLKRADTLIANLNQRVETFERAAKSAERLGDSGTALSDAMLSDTVPRLNLLTDDLQRTARGLERTLNDLNEQPHSLIFGRNPVPPGPGEAGFAAKGAQ
jgi:phospholipid/cholesterol/gamma-HCH transport system substrate-binding protein